jgi:hypothetical protein
LAGCDTPVDVRDEVDRSDRVDDALDRNPARSEQDRPFRMKRNDGRFHTDCTRSIVENHPGSVAELSLNMFRCGRTDTAEAIGARRGDGAVDEAKEFAGDSVVGNSHRDRWQFGRHNIGNALALR